MFDIGFQEMLLIAVLVIVFIPADDLPEMMRTLGRYYAKIRRASDDLRRAFNSEVARTDADRRREDLTKRRERAGGMQAVPGAVERKPEEAAIPGPVESNPEEAALPGPVESDPEVAADPADPRLPADAAKRKAQN